MSRQTDSSRSNGAANVLLPFKVHVCMGIFLGVRGDYK